MKVISSERKAFWGAWFGAVVWNGIIGFGLLSDWRKHSLASKFTYNQPQDLIGIIFPIIGIALLLWAIRQTILWSAYGETSFVSDAEIFPLGGRLYGKIQFSHPVSALTVRRFRLELLYQVRIDNSNRNTPTAWSDVHSINLAPDGSIPVNFSLPAEVKPTAFIVQAATRLVWSLRVREIGGGLRSFAAEYILPAEEYRRPTKSSSQR
jgi:hypothetical protein